ncbi:dolichyl-phosphate-mannose---protein mannosyltransferase [Chytriomyces confervae]|uniref:Dolichyl-phosphate-mannose--protein mannosyltransferase n=1 Tax=Chytriomyces confervae TaxID=246404 RepID=A0A507ENF1_9FUNG|nr:dolichyl-phosphate-mannose---protein mannosyltransferase [Chytriomyces confervae]
MAETELRKRPAAKATTVNGQPESAKPEFEKPVATFTEDADPQAKNKIPKKKNSFNVVPYIALLLTIASVFTRVYRLGRADFVVWDEAHFGKFASFYIKRSFYFDVHPPLGKTLLGASGLFVGYNGSFPFESGKQYPPELNYTGMRAFCSLIGSLMVPLGFYTGLQLKMSILASTFLATMVMLDVALLSISRFILLDSLLLFFTALSAYCLVVFRNYQKTEPLSTRWHIWMAYTGISIGCCLSVKWVGLFVIALVGLNTLEDLWVMLGDLKMPVRTYARHWIVRIAFLILLPAAVYVFSFWLHFTILNESGEGDAQMSSLFQANLQGNNFHENPISIAYGSKISIKNGARGGGLLHSHIQTYPPGASGSEQQQVTCYHHKDQNNEWIVMTPAEEDMPAENEIKYLYEGDTIRLQHDQTKKLLHSHPLVAPVSKAHWEVSGYGNLSIPDPNDLWVVEIVKDGRLQLEGEKREIRSLTTRFALRHKALGCLLHSGESKNLPEWGFKQAEVYCDKTADVKNPGNLWNVEQHWNSLLPPGGAAAYPQSFWRDFIDLNIAMWQANNALTPDPTKEPDQLTSKPHQWPIMQVGLRMCGWGDNELKYFLLGNPVVWIGSTVALVVFAAVCFVYLVRAQRRCGDWKNEDELDDFMFAGKVGVLGWFLHYLPFFIMGRVMYLHHYFPALYFAIILFAFVVDHLAKRTGKVLHAVILLAFTAGVVAVFVQFSDFVFGMDGPATQWAHLKWISTWNVFDGVAGSVGAALSGDFGGAGSGSA